MFLKAGQDIQNLQDTAGTNEPTDPQGTLLTTSAKMNVPVNLSLLEDVLHVGLHVAHEAAVYTCFVNIYHKLYIYWISWSL